MKGLPEDFKVTVVGIHNNWNNEPPPTVKKVVAFLDKQPLKELFTTRQVAEQTECSIGTLHRHSNSHWLQLYRYPLNQNFTYWGSRETIDALKIKMAEEG